MSLESSMAKGRWETGALCDVGGVEVWNAALLRLARATIDEGPGAMAGALGAEPQTCVLPGHLAGLGNFS